MNDDKPRWEFLRMVSGCQVWELHRPGWRLPVKYFAYQRIDHSWMLYDISGLDASRTLGAEALRDFGALCRALSLAHGGVHG